MKLRYRIASGFLIFIAIALTSGALIFSHNSGCEPAPALDAGQPGMQAVVARCYGSADVLSLETIEKPVPGDDEVLVKVHAAAVNPLDWHFMRGSPYLMRIESGIGAPNDVRTGVDFAGTVEAVGASVRTFEPGDAVFGGRSGAFGEYVVVAEDRGIVHKPDNISFEQAAAVPIAAVTALEALRDKGDVQPGDRVLINGASGGVGTFAVQIAKSMGAHVTGVCSTRNVELVRSLGADEVIDYKQDSYIALGGQYDVIIDMVGNHPLADNEAALRTGGRFVIVGGPKGNWFGPFVTPVMALLRSPEDGKVFHTLLATMRKASLERLAGLLASGDVTPVIDRRYALQDVADAIRYSESGRARGKIIVQVDERSME